MHHVAQKVFIALDSIVNVLGSIEDRRENNRVSDVFFVLDTLMTFEGAINRAIDRTAMQEMTLAIRSAMRLYSLYIDGHETPWESVLSSTKRAKNCVLKNLDSLRNG
jgi:hypothetical protein